MVDRETDHDEMVDEREEKVVDHDEMVDHERREEMVDFDPSQVFNKLERKITHDMVDHQFISLTTYHVIFCLTINHLIFQLKYREERNWI